LKLGASLDASKMEAQYRNGLLLITMPKVENAKPRQIRVQLTSTAAPEATPHN
jgi:HSP20 family molecular chaperone IbpA